MPRKLWTAAEWEKLSPAEQDRIFEESLVVDPTQVPLELLEQARADFRRLTAEHDTHKPG